MARDFRYDTESEPNMRIPSSVRELVDDDNEVMKRLVSEYGGHSVTIVRGDKLFVGWSAGRGASFAISDLREIIGDQSLSTRNAELEWEVKRLREAVGLLETANSLRRNSSSDVVYEDYYDGPKVEDLEDQAHTLSTSPQGADHA